VTATDSTAPAGSSTPVRLGFHETPHLVSGIIARAGLDPWDFALVPYDVREPFRLLRSGDVDAMVVKYGLREPDITVGPPVGWDERVLLVGAGHPLASRAGVSVEEAALYEAFARPEGFPGYVWDRVVPPRTPAGTPIRRVHALTTVEALVGTLTSTQAVHLSFRSVEAALPPQVKAVAVEDLPSAPVSLAWLSGSHQPGPVRDFLRAAAAAAVPDPAAAR
jgi:hypothetical protein